MSEGCRSVGGPSQVTGGEDFKVIWESLSRIEKGWEKLEEVVVANREDLAAIKQRLEDLTYEFTSFRGDFEEA